MPPSARFEAVKGLSEAGIFTGILMPVLPFLEDNEENVISIVRKAHEAGAKFIYPAFGMTNEERQQEWYYAKLKEIFPEEDYVSRYQKRYGSAINVPVPEPPLFGRHSRRNAKMQDSL